MLARQLRWSVAATLEQQEEECVGGRALWETRISLIEDQKLDGTK